MSTPEVSVVIPVHVSVVIPVHVSVVIPVHNGGDTLVEQLDSLRIAMRDAPSTEILVVDNRSTDDSAAVAKAWAAEHDIDLRVVAADDKAGEPHARNVGLTEARGRCVLYCDADDRVSKDWIATLASALESSHYATTSIDMDALNPTWLANTRGRSVVEGRSMLFDVVPYAHGCSMGFRRDTLLALGGFDEDYLAGCDLDIAIRMWQAGHDLQFCDNATLHYRLRPSLRATYDQGVFYGRWRVPIRQRLAAVAGIPVVDPRNPRRILWLVRKLPTALAHRPTRARWVWVLGQLIGDRRGRRRPPIVEQPARLTYEAA